MTPIRRLALSTALVALGIGAFALTAAGPRASGMHPLQAKCLSAMDDPAEVEAACDTLLDAGFVPRIGLLAGRSVARFRTGRLTEAMDDAEAALAIDGGYLYATMMKGRILLDMGDRAEGARLLAKVVAWDPAHRPGDPSRRNARRFLMAELKLNGGTAHPVYARLTPGDPLRAVLNEALGVADAATQDPAAMAALLAEAVDGTSTVGTEHFVNFLRLCRAAGADCPPLPGSVALEPDPAPCDRAAETLLASSEELAAFIAKSGLSARDFVETRESAALLIRDYLQALSAFDAAMEADAAGAADPARFIVRMDPVLDCALASIGSIPNVSDAQLEALFAPEVRRNVVHVARVVAARAG